MTRKPIFALACASAVLLATSAWPLPGDPYKRAILCQMLPEKGTKDSLTYKQWRHVRANVREYLLGEIDAGRRTDEEVSLDIARALETWYAMTWDEEQRNWQECTLYFAPY